MTVLIDLVGGDPSATRPRHPEKAHRPDQPVARKPAWIRVKAPGSRTASPQTNAIVREHKLATVCEEARCPNIGECWEKKHATFMIMGETCTRACAFCNVRTGLPDALDAAEPARVADAVAKLGLAHVVVTSVDRDDLADGGAEHFARTIRAIRARRAGDHHRSADARFPAQGRRAGNRRRRRARCLQPQSRDRAVEVSRRAARRALFPFAAAAAARQGARRRSCSPSRESWSGLGEERNEVLQLMDDLRSADVDFLTIGQYLQPTPKHHQVMRFVTPEEFQSYATVGAAKGFLLVSATPLTRSSHHAGEDFAKLKAARLAKTSTPSSAPSIDPRRARL